MKEALKTLCITLGLVGMMFSCSGHRVVEKSTLEIEETEVEDLLSRRDDSERQAQRKHAFAKNRLNDPCAPQTRIILRSLAGNRPTCERNHFNGIGAFLLI